MVGLASFAFPALLHAQLYTQNQTLFGDANPSEYFGYDVAASGDTFAVSTSSNKRIYVFVNTPSGWVLQQKIAATYSDYSFGHIAIDGDTLVAGEEIYFRSGGVWTLQQSLPFHTTDTRPAVQGDTVAIGVPRAANGDASGSVYVFTRSGTTWTQQALLLPDTPGQVQMGAQVRIDHGTIVAATQNGSFGPAAGAYVFTGSAATWTQQAKLVSPTGGWWMSVAIDGDTLALSDPPNNRIYLFTRSGTSWSITDTIPIPATGGSDFGDALALTGGLIAASADSVYYVLSKTSTGWTVGQSFPHSGRAGYNFGSLGLARLGKTFVLSSPYDNTQAYANGMVEVFSVPSPPPPGSGWRDDDVGAVGVSGSSADNGGTVTVSGSGADIWDRADQFHLRSQTLTGDGAIVARVTSTGSGDPWSKIGLMFREDLAPAARTAMLLLTPGNHFGTQFRADTFDTTSFQDAGWAGPPQWMMLARAGNTFASYRSDDGVSWVPIGSATLVMPATVYVGLAVSSHDNTVLNTATFDGAEIVPAGQSGRPNPPSNLIGSLVTGTSVRLQWTDNSTDETGFVVERGIGASATQFVALVGANVTDYTDSGLANGTTYTYQVRAARGSVTSAASNTFTITTATSSYTLTGSQLGSTDVGGSFSTSGGTLSLAAAGADIWNESDSGYFVNQSVTGDFDLRAHITFLSDLNAWTKAGVMVRESLDAGARNVFTLLTAENVSGMQVRDTFGAATTLTAGPWVRTPYWVRLVRTGNTFESFVSADGTAWQSIGTVTLALPTTLSAGIAMSSHVANTTAHATADSLTFTPN